MERLLVFVTLLYVVSASHFIADDGSLILSPSTGQTEESLPVLIPQNPSHAHLQNSPFLDSQDSYLRSLESPLKFQFPTSEPFLPQVPVQILTRFQQLPQIPTTQIFLPLPQQFSAPQTFLPPPFPLPQAVQPVTTFSPQQNPICSPPNSLIDAMRGGRAYHFSWCREPRHFSWDQANSYCQSVHPDFQSISIEDRDEDDFVTNVLATHSIKYIWTSGNKLGSNSWRWLSLNPVIYNNWSFTGGLGKPQPDNREGSEVCLGVLNNVFNDGIKWHDIPCHYLKPVICETSA